MFGQQFNPWDDPLAFLRLQQQSADPFAGGVNGPDAPQQQGLMARLTGALLPGQADMDPQDRRALMNQGLLSAGLGILANNNQGRNGGAAIGSGLLGGLQAMNQGSRQLAENQYRRQMMDRQLGDPAGLREFNALTEGLSDEEKAQARKVRLGIEGRASSAGFSQFKFTGPDGRERLGVLNGRTGRIDTPDGLSFDPATVQITGQVEPAAPGASAAGPEQMDAQMAEIGRKATEYGYRLKSLGADPATVDQMQSAYFNDLVSMYAGSNPGSVIDNGAGQRYGAPVDRDPSTFTPAPALPRPSPSAGQNPFVSPTAGEVETDKERARLAAQLAALPAQLRIQVESELGKQREESKIKPTKAQESVDSAYGKEYLDFTQGGAADANKALTELKDVLDQLKGGGQLTGPVLGALPNFVKARTNPGAMAAQETVESTVQRSLRVILGAQFTEKEGERLIARAYNPSLSEAENAIRVQRLFDQLKQGFENKAAAARYYEENGTLRGFKGKLPSWGDFDPDNDTGSGLSGGVDDLLSKYGIQ